MALLFLGDFYYGYDYIAEDIFKMSKFIKRNNYSVILNLEGPITTATKEIYKRGEHLRQSMRTIEVLKLLNVVAVSLANNHMMDYGEEGLRDTIQLLDANNIQHSGAGKNIDEAFKAIKVVADNVKYRIFCMSDSYEEAIIAGVNTSGCAPISTDVLPDSKDATYTNIVFLHTGFEYNTFPMPRNIKEAESFIKKGSSYVICSHPHLVQGKMVYEDGEIFYSLGNFYFSNFRDEFNGKKIGGKKGFCNLGYGIVIENRKTEVLEINYYPSSRQSFLKKSDEIEILDNNYLKKKGYLFKCYANRNNHNPILFGNKWIDNILLEGLFCLYAVYRFVRRK